MQALVLGLVQALTEFLPVSSSGHLIIFPLVLGWEVQPLVFDTVLHLATALALLVFFSKDIAVILKGFLLSLKSHGADFNKYSSDGKLGLYILVGSVPAVIFGLLLENYIESTFRSLQVVSVFLLLGSFLLFFAEKYYSKVFVSEDELSKSLSYKKALTVGVFQSLALLPGISRSGATISAGMFFGLGRVSAARFSFLLSIPVVVGAGLFKVMDSFTYVSSENPVNLLIGFIASFVMGMLVIKFLLGFLKNNSLYWFVAYRIIFSGFLLYLAYFR